jgi:hypothetical protein
MTTIDLVPVRTQLIKTFNFLAEKAKLVDNLLDFSNFPTAYTFHEKTSVKQQALEECVMAEYKLPGDRIETALKDLENKGIVEIHQVDLQNERVNYVQLTDKALYPTDKDLENLFSKNLG